MLEILVHLPQRLYLSRVLIGMDTGCAGCRWAEGFNVKKTQTHTERDKSEGACRGAGGDGTCDHSMPTTWLRVKPPTSPVGNKTSYRLSGKGNFLRVEQERSFPTSCAGKKTSDDLGRKQNLLQVEYEKKLPASWAGNKTSRKLSMKEILLRSELENNLLPYDQSWEGNLLQVERSTS